ncbi:MAG: hypothetical protein ABI348_10180 [Nitrososphaera sp.]
MKIDAKYFGAIFGALVLFTTTWALPEASAYWHVGADHSLSSIVEVRTNANTPSLPNSSAISATTLYWLGADVTGGADNILTQPELRAWDSTQWRASFETVSETTGNRVEFFWTNVYYTPGTSIQFDDALGSHQDCQYVTDINNSLKTASQCLNAVDYGTSMNEAYATLESYDYTGSDFHSMNGSVSFTNYLSYTSIGGTGSSQALSPYRFSSTASSPPSCITSSGGTGSATVTVNC